VTEEPAAALDEDDVEPEAIMRRRTPPPAENK
jgi:hypothetical protein